MTKMRKILVVEDNKPIRTMVEKLFVARGYEVDTAANGEEGLTFARQGGYSAIITDLKMPQMDGLVFLQKLKALLPHSANGPVVVFTSAEYAKVEAEKAGADLFVAKEDTEPNSLFEQVDGLINSLSAK